MSVLLRTPEVDDPDFIAEMSYGSEGAVLRLSGSADKTTAAAIGKMFDALHDELCERGVRLLVVDTRDCDYMAATCFRQLLAWIGKVQEMAADKRYRLRLRGNSSLAWQKHGLSAVACFDTELISIEVT